MSDTLELHLKTTWLPTLGQIMGNVGPLSPFAAGSPDASAQAEMTQGGLLDVEGRIQERYLPALQSLAAPPRVARLRFISPEAAFEYHGYFDGTGGDPVALISTEGGFLLRSPASQNDVMGLVAEHAGVSEGVEIPFSVELPEVEARVALALVDATRHLFLVAMAKEDEPAVPVVQPDDLTPRLLPDSVHLNRLETAYRELELDDSTLDAQTVMTALQSLVGRGLVQQVDGGWGPGGALQRIASAMPLVGGIYRFDSASTLSTGEIAAGRGIVVQGGHRALLLMEHEAGTVRIGGLSGEAFLLLVAPIFAVGMDVDEPEPPAAPAPPVTTPPPPAPEVEPQAGPRFCGKCGSPVTPGMKFCGKCGNAMS